MKKNTFLRVSFRALLFLVCFELFLNVSGIAARWIQTLENRTGSSGQEYRIMVIGESMSYEGGADAYPKQLERILNDSGRGYKVINKAIPDGNSAWIVNRVPEWSAEEKPAMIVAMLGMSDFAALEKAEAPAWSRLKTVRLLKHFLDRSAGSAEEPPSVERAAPTKVGQTPLIRASEQERKVYTVVQVLQTQEAYEKAASGYRNLIENCKDPGLKHYFRLRFGECLLLAKDYKGLARLFKDLLEENPRDPWVIHSTVLACREENGRGIMRKLFDHLMAERPQESGFKDLAAACALESGDTERAAQYRAESAALQKGKWNPETRRNLIKLWKFCRESGIRLVLVQYPLRPVQSLEMMLQGEEASEQIIFVDNEEDFRRALEDFRYQDLFKDYAGGNFGHCTSRGYKILAENIAEKIREYVE